MYNFTKHSIDWLNIYVFRPEVGDVWKKRFTAGTTPANQETLNIYALGSFRTSAIGFSQDFQVGDTSLDTALVEFPSGEDYSEEPVTAPACRLCISTQDKSAWKREKKTISAGATVNLMQGQLAFVLPLTGWSGGGAPDLRNAPFVMPVDGFVYVFTKAA